MARRRTGGCGRSPSIRSRESRDSPHIAAENGTRPGAGSESSAMPAVRSGPLSPERRSATLLTARLVDGRDEERPLGSERVSLVERNGVQVVEPGQHCRIPACHPANDRVEPKWDSIAPSHAPLTRTARTRIDSSATGGLSISSRQPAPPAEDAALDTPARVAKVVWNLDLVAPIYRLREDFHACPEGVILRAELKVCVAANLLLLVLKAELDLVQRFFEGHE